jgi:hypothetical protein
METSPENLNAGDNISPTDSKVNVFGEQTAEERTKELLKSLEKVDEIFKNHCKDIAFRLNTWLVILGIVFILILIFYNQMFNYDYKECEWSWRIGYKMVIRGSAMIALFSLFAFIIKMIRSYLYMFESNKHKQAIINSMAYFVGSGISSEQRELIYIKMIELVVKMVKTGLITKENELKDLSVFNEILNKAIKSTNVT